MFSVTRLLDVAASERDRIVDGLRSAASASDAVRQVVQLTLPGSRNGGDILAHLRFDSAAQWQCAAPLFRTIVRDAAVSRVSGVDYPGTPVRESDSAGTVYRTLLLRVQPDTDEATVARFEQELSMMPRYVPAIRAWQLSRVTEAIGPTAWTHVFEQEFCDVDGLLGPYLMHPIHWAVVDRWFDPETTDVIIRDRVCHSFCDLPGVVLS